MFFVPAVVYESPSGINNNARILSGGIYSGSD